MGLVVIIVPEGDIRVAAEGGKIKTVNGISLLQGPVPAEFLVWIRQLHEPTTSAMAGVTEQVPVPEVQPQAEAVYHCWILVPVESSTHR